MDLSFILNSPWFTFLVIPILIFFARILDVSIGTLRVIFITRGYKKIAPFLGFIEVLIWLIAIRQIITNISNPITYFAYAAGFAMGTYTGIYIEEKISIGKVMLRIITGKNSTQLLKSLDKSKFTFTTFGADGPDGKVNLIITVVNRKDVPLIVKIINNNNPHAFYSIEDVRFAHEDSIPKNKLELFRIFRNAK